MSTAFSYRTFHHLKKKPCVSFSYNSQILSIHSSPKPTPKQPLISL